MKYLKEIVLYALVCKILTVFGSNYNSMNGITKIVAYIIVVFAIEFILGKTSLGDWYK